MMGQALLRFILISLIFSSIACTRSVEQGKTTRVVLATASKGVSASSLPTYYKHCYGVDVSASDISAPTATCSPAFGSFSGFTEAGGTLSVTVNSGAGRNVTLYLYLADLNGTCPTWNQTFRNNPSESLRVFKVATATGVTLSGATASLEMTAIFPGLDGHVFSQLPAGNSCQVQAAAKAYLWSNGQITDTNQAAFSLDPSSPTNEAFGKSATNAFVHSAAGRLSAFGATTVDVAPAYYSVTMKPDTGVYYAMSHAGTVVRVTASGSIDSSATCPFATCTVPVWFKSITAGAGSDLFGLDHGGNLYKMNADGSVTKTGTGLNPAISQVAFH